MYEKVFIVCLDCISILFMQRIVRKPSYEVMLIVDISK